MAQENERRSVERLVIFTDAIMAISMTLLVLDVRLPGEATSLDDASLGAMLSELWPNYFGYALSFLVIGNYWVGHTHKFKEIRAVDGGILWINMLFLLVIGFIPFVTSVLSENSGRLGTSLYAATLTIASALMALLWLYADRKGLIDPEVSREERKRALIRPLIGAAVFLASMLIAQYDADIAKYVWLLLIVFAVSRMVRRSPTADRNLP